MEGLRAALAYANVLAVLRCVRHSESNNAEDGSAYWLLFGSARAPSLAHHPRIAIKSAWGWTSAAGAYQAMCAVPGKVTTDTWGDFCRAMGTTADEMPFDEQTQDLFAVWCLRRRNALSDAIAGNLPAVVEKCSHEWASWPPGRYGQPTTTYAKLEAVYLAYGGTLAASDSEPIAQMIDTQPAAPIEDKGVQMEQPAASPSFDWSSVLQVGGAVASFFNPAIGVLISSLGGLAQQKIEKELSRHTDPATAKTVAAQLSTALADAATKATGKSDPIAAIAELRANPAAVAQVEAAVTTKIEQINELTEVGGGIVEARKAGADPAALPAWRQGPFWISLILLLVGGAIVGSVLWGAGWRPEDKSQVLMLAVSLFSMTGGFWLGSSIGSSRKTDMFNNARAP